MGERKVNGAGEGNRTLVCSLGSCRSTIELHPLCQNKGEVYADDFDLAIFVCKFLLQNRASRSSSATRCWIALRVVWVVVLRPKPSQQKEAVTLP